MIKPLIKSAFENAVNEAVKDVVEDLSLDDDMEAIVDTARRQYLILIKSRRFQAYLRACLFSEIRELLAGQAILSYFDEEDKKYMIKRALMELLDEEKASDIGTDKPAV